MSTTVKIAPGQKFSVLYENGSYYDCTVTSLTKQRAHVVFSDGEIGEYHINDLEPPIVPAVSDRFSMLAVPTERSEPLDLLGIVGTILDATPNGLGDVLFYGDPPKV